MAILQAGLGPSMSAMKGQDDVLFGYIASKQWKQALKLCEKKLKMTPGSDYHLVTKISILVQWQDQARLDQGIGELNRLLERKTPVVDIEALCALDTVIEEISLLEDLGPKQKQTWQRAAMSRPQDEKLHEAWYWIKFREMDYRGAQQACMTWMKNFPTERKPFFLYILCTHLVSVRTGNEQERSLMQTLAHRTISKAAQDRQSSGNETSTSGREIAHIEDLLLLVRVYTAAGRNSEASKILADPLIGFQNYIGRSRWELLRQYLGLLTTQQQNHEVREICIAILKESRHDSFENSRFNIGKLGDDWKTWQTLVSANAQDDPDTNSPAVEELISSFCGSSHKTTERNARMALLLFHAVEVSAGRRSQNLLLTALTKYFESFSTKLAFFSDVKQWLSLLNIGRQKQLLSDCAKFSQSLKPQSKESLSNMIYWITCEINLLKLEYNLVISQDRNSHDTNLLTAFISSCLRVYKLSLAFGYDLPVSDRRPGDDAALLAAMGLIRLFKSGRKPALIQCIVVLEHTLLQSKHNYDAILILVRLYVFLGAGSLAMERYSRLSIKNLQHSTISWVLYTRLSSIHPYPATYSSDVRRQSTIDPLEDIVNAFRWHASAEAISLSAVRRMQANGQWAMSLDALTTSEAVSDGFTKVLMAVEAKRIARIRSTPYESPKERIRVADHTRDHRDRGAFPNIEGGDLSFEQHLPAAGSSTETNFLQNKWLHQQLSLVWFWDVLHNDGQTQITKEQLRVLAASSKGEPDALTVQEHAIAQLITALSTLYSIYFQNDEYKDKAPALFVETLLNQIEEWLVKSSNRLSSTKAPMRLTPELNVPSWSVFHDLFTQLEMCKFVKITFEYAVSENKKHSCVGQAWLVDKVEDLRKKYTNLATAVSQMANKMRHDLQNQATLHEFEGIVVGGFDVTDDQDAIISGLRSLGDYTKLEKICHDIRDSWVDGLEGVIRTKIV